MFKKSFFSILNLALEKEDDKLQYWIYKKRDKFPIPKQAQKRIETSE